MENFSDHNGCIDNSIAIECKNLSKIFIGAELPALNNINIEIKYGQINGLVGPDGAGKTTLIRILASLLSPSAGGWYFNQNNFSLEEDKNIGYMPQRFGLYEDLSVIDNLNLHGDLRALTKSEK